MLNAGPSRTRAALWAGIVGAIALVAIPGSIGGVGAEGQAGSATFSGVLLDPQSRTLPGKGMVLTHVLTRRQHRTTTDAAGRFVFDELAAGDYNLDAEVPGLERRQPVTIAAGRNLSRDVTLRMGSLTETLYVRKGAAERMRTGTSTLALDPRTAGRPYDCGRPVTIGGCILEPRKVTHVQPVYPAGRDEIKVEVRLSGRIDTDGRVTNLRVLSPADGDFATAALDAVKQWEFTPTFLGGVPVAVTINVTVNFGPR